MGKKKKELISLKKLVKSLSTVHIPKNGLPYSVIPKNRISFSVLIFGYNHI